MSKQDEKYFPRGGRKPAVSQEETKNFKRKWNRSFDSISPAKKIKEQLEIEKLPPLVDISLKTVSEGMVILGYVREVNDVELKLNLPGRVIGYVPATNISEEYTAYLKKLLTGAKIDPISLTQMFKAGQKVIAKVEEISSSEIGRKRVTLTLFPNLIYDDISLNDVMKGIVLSASVQSVEDHGYVMNCGIPSVRAFLKKSQALNYEEMWNDGRPLGVGQVIRCLILKCDTTDGSSNVQLQAVAEAKVEESDVPLKSLITGMCCQMSVSKVIPSGLVVELPDKKTGYVHSNYLKKNYRSLNESDLLQGCVMYIEPLTKNVFLTALETHHLPREPFENIQKGQKFEKAKVISSKRGTMQLELEENTKSYGYVSNHHLGIKLPESVEENFSEILEEKYPMGSTHPCKVLEYDYMLQKYICTLDKNVINQKFSSLDEITPGIVTDCIVEKSTPRQILLKVDAIRGIVEPMHCTDIPISMPDTMLKTGQRVKAKVLAVKKPICEFTLKPILIHSKNPMLTKFTDAKDNVPYDGVIVSVNKKGVVVKFYGDFKSFVPKRNLGNCEFKEPEDIYYVGQVVTCYVESINFDEERITFKAEPWVDNDTEKLKNKKGRSENEEKIPLKVGMPYVVHVNKISSEGVIVKEQASGITGLIPLAQLTDYVPMANAICQLYKKDDRLHTYCLSCKDKIIFTASPTFIEHFQSLSGKQLTKQGFSKLMGNMIVPATVTEISIDGITVKVPMQKDECYVFVKSSEFQPTRKQEVDLSSLGIEVNQTVVLQINQVFHNTRSVGSFLFSKNEELSKNGLMLLKDYLTCHKRIHADQKNKGLPIGKVDIGSVVKGTISTISSFGVIVDLDIGIKAEVKPEHCQNLSLDKGMLVEGTVLFVDVINRCVEISLREDIRKRFALQGEPPGVGKLSMCEVLVSRPEVTICSLFHGRDNHHVVYVPTRWHVNGCQPLPYFEVGERNKIIVKMCVDDLLIGIPRKLEVLERRKGRVRPDHILTSKSAGSIKHDIGESNFMSINTNNEEMEIKGKRKEKRQDGRYWQISEQREDR